MNKIRKMLPRWCPRLFAMVSVLLLLLSSTTTAFAAVGNVTYTGDAGQIIFGFGSDYSPTDLFHNFKEVMPGDSIVQTITVKNDASNEVKVKIYIRSLGAHAESEELLSKLHLRVEAYQENTMAYMFDSSADATAQLSEWVCLGTLYSGGEVNLNVILDIPVELENPFQGEIGLLSWEFMIEEYPVEPTDPEPPKTGDDTPIWGWVALMGVSLFAIILLVILIRREKKKD